MLATIMGKRDAVALLTLEQREKDQAQREQMKRGGEGQHGGSKGAITRAGSRAGNNTNTSELRLAQGMRSIARMRTTW
jgi:hypothetical protein